MLHNYSSRFFEEHPAPVENSLRKMVLVEHPLEVYSDEGLKNDAEVSTMRKARDQSRSKVFLVDIGSVVSQ